MMKQLSGRYHSSSSGELLRSLRGFLLVAILCRPRPVQAFCPTSFLPRRSRAARSSLHASVVTEILMQDDDSNSHHEEKKSTRRLTRPERKALERDRKNNNNKRRKHNFADRKTTLQGHRRQGEGRYDLHSTAVANLNTETTTADDVMRAIKRAQNLHDVHDIRAIERFLLEQTDATFAYGYRGSLLARLAVAALHMNNHELARKAMEERKKEHRESMLPMESAALIRGLLRVHNVTDALHVLDDELALVADDDDDASFTSSSKKDLIKHRALSLTSIASRYFFEGEPDLAVNWCRKLAEMGPIVRQAGLTGKEVSMPWTRILTGASQCESRRRDGSVRVDDDADHPLPCNVVYSVLNTMTTFPPENNDRVYEMLSNALVRRVVFVTGAVDMLGCPPADRGEAAFIGRSNVGKSSLVNMITNRKSLAYTSKRPGKTQQFNFFAVNDKPGREKEIKYGDGLPGEKDLDSFYIVDLPGFGFARVPQQQRRQWAEVMRQYISSRKTLRVLFHLVDGRHGPTNEDALIMKQVGEDLPSQATYVVVLTKADKNVKGASSTKNSGKVSVDVMNRVRAAMNENGVGNAPVILSSAETKLGRDDLWRYLRRAAEA